MITKRFLVMLMLVCSIATWATTTTNPTAVTNLVNRVCGAGASSNFTFTLDTEFNSGAEAFQLGGSAGAVTIKANTLSALTCGLNWYLNHEAHVNISWNNLTQTVASFPAPADTRVHASDGPYRYYLNYCTFSYSMAFWDEARWMKEIDWMALHGVNISLQIVGVDALWYKMLTEDYSFTHAEASAWIAGPAHQAWWLMDNLSGMGGPNPAEWYTRQAALGRKIVERMVELGIEPAIPGFIGMVPERIAGSSPYTGTWTSGINCPVVINATQTTVFDGIAQNYYKRLKEVFGYSPKYYANDVMHERDNATGSQENYKAVCDNTRKAMEDYAKDGNGENPTWIAQMWQSNAEQFRINALSDSKTLLLDLSSERTTYKGRYGSKEYLFCMLHNYGGNIGMYGCMQKMLDEYRAHKTTGIANDSNGTLKGVGATPEGIETNPVLYDMLFELPWYGSDINAETWLNDYATSRYGVVNTDAQHAWNRLRTTVYDNTSSSQQGCREPVFCARPNLSGNNASAWAGASYNWDKDEVIAAAYELLSLGSAANATNYNYDVVDFARQALTDYAHTLQMDMAASTPYTGTRFAAQSDGFLQLMRDIDALLGTVEDFRLGRWVGAARKIATTEVPLMTAPAGFTSAADWLEWNARLLPTLWRGDNVNSAGGLMEYANREYQGLITGYYLPRWQYYFDNLKAGGSGPSSDNLYNKVERAFVYGQTNDADVYTAIPYGTYTAGAAEGDAVATARTMMQKYFGKLANGAYYSPWTTTDKSDVAALKLTLAGKTAAEVLAALETVFTTKTTGSTITAYAFDINGNGRFTDETLYTDGSLPVCPNFDAKCCIYTSDGAQVVVTANIGRGTAPTTVTMNGWTYNGTNVGLELTLTGVVSGSGACVIPEAVAVDGNTYRIGALGADCFKNNTSVTSVTLPATLRSLGGTSRVKAATLEDTSDNSRYYKLPETLSKNGQWAIDVKMRIGSDNFNNWGTLCFAPYHDKVNPSASYTGFQFYQNRSTNSSGDLHIMPEHDGHRWITNAGLEQHVSLLNKTVNVHIDFNNGHWTLHVTSAEGDDATLAYNLPISNDISYLNFQLGTDSEILSVTCKNGADDISSLLTKTLTSTYAGVTSGSGDASQYQTIALPVTLKDGENWTLTAEVTYNGTAFNQWGSGLLAIGTNPMATTYTNAFQLYLDKSSNKIIVKKDGGNMTTIDCALSTSATNTVTITHTASTGVTRFQVNNGTSSSYYDHSNSFDDFTTMSCAIAAGTTVRLAVSGDAVDALTFTPFYGCSNLERITVANGNTQYASENGALYNADKTILLRVPAQKTANFAPATNLAIVTDRAFDEANSVKLKLTQSQYAVVSGLAAPRVELPIQAASVMPVAGSKYYIAAQCLVDGKWIERFLYLDGTTARYTSTPNNSCEWTAITNGDALTLQAPNGKYFYRGAGSDDVHQTVVANTTTSLAADKGFVTIYTDTGGNGRFALAMNDGSGSAFCTNEGDYLPNTTIYTPYFKFYEIPWTDTELHIGGMVFNGQVKGSEARLDTYIANISDDITLTHAATADGNDYTVADLTPVFNVLKKNVTTPTTVTIASNVTSLGEAYPAYVPQRSAGYAEPIRTTDGGYTRYDYRWTLTPELSGDCWNLNIKARIGEKQLNKWGGAAIATGTDPTPKEDPFTGGFQFYQHGANSDNVSNRGKLTLTSSGVQALTNNDGRDPSLINTDVTFEFKYRSGNMTLIYFTENGQSGKKTWTNTVTSISNLCAAFADDADILGMTYNFINEESTEPVAATTWLNNQNITIQLEDGYTGPYCIDEKGSLWGSARQQQLLRVPSAAQLAGAGNHFTVPTSMLAISPDAFLNNPSAKVSIPLQQYLMVDDLLKPGNVSIPLSEESAGEEGLIRQVHDKTFAEVTISDRTIAADKWNTLTLPFGISTGDCSDLFKDVRKLNSIAKSGDNITLQFETVSSIEAGTPYLVKAKEETTGLTATGTKLSAAGTTTVNGGGYQATFHGNYDQKTINEGEFFISSNRFYYANSDVTVKGFRAYITIDHAPEAEAASVRQLYIGMWEDMPVGIEVKGLDNDQPRSYYDLSGRRYDSRPTTPGMYITGGRKIITTK